MHRRLKQWMRGAALAAVALVLTERPDAQTGGATAFVGARVVVGDGTAPIENATVVVRDGQIAEVEAVGPRARASGRHARGLGWQDPHADHRRHARASRHDT